MVSFSQEKEMKAKKAKKAKAVVDAAAAKLKAEKEESTRKLAD